MAQVNYSGSLTPYRQQEEWQRAQFSRNKGIIVLVLTPEIIHGYASLIEN